jgi:hypothetical protein
MERLATAVSIGHKPPSMETALDISEQAKQIETHPMESPASTTARTAVERASRPAKTKGAELSPAPVEMNTVAFPIIRGDIACG